MKILMLHRQQSAVGYYRSWVPARALRAAGHVVACDEELPLEKLLGRTPEERQLWARRQIEAGFDLLWVDRAVEDADLQLLTGVRHYSKGCRMIVDFDDDFTQIPAWNQAAPKYRPGQPARTVGFSHLALSEMTTVSTEPLARRFTDEPINQIPPPHAHAVRVCPNMLDPADWVGLTVDPERAQDPHLRVLYGGAAGHYGDLDAARHGLEAVLDNPPVPFRLICFGALPVWVHEAARRHPQRVVSLPWVPFKDYPQAVAWGGFDIALAPLAAHPFNEAKSSIKWMEAGAQGIPFLCSDVGPYSAIPDGAAIKVDNTPAQWAEGLRALLTDAAMRQRLAKTAREAVLDGFTVDRLGKAWETAAEEAMERPRIERLEDARLPRR